MGTPPRSPTTRAATRCFSVADPLGHVTTNVYDAAREPGRTTDPSEGHELRLQHPGLLTITADPLNQTTSFTYDSLEPMADRRRGWRHHLHVRRQRQPVTQSVTRTLVGGGAQTLTTIPVRRAEPVGEDLAIRKARLRRSQNNSPQVVATIDELGRRTSFTYDSSMALPRPTLPDGTNEKSDFDAERRRTRTIDRGNHQTFYTLRQPAG